MKKVASVFVSFFLCLWIIIPIGVSADSNGSIEQTLADIWNKLCNDVEFTINLNNNTIFQKQIGVFHLNMH